ncbi:hypothetical protein Kpol_1016p2 [Vanderwaltozyma polyspora DSM 70294]|uniref:Vacuolar protein sorting-associated protein 74 n=1 Tax=Vanderwaltozyma polyspora (strain ATCC 22028 / DSM 70294 / BCRC 21397 / CBS 2163 / NBRC 10782 / NRRL Y-8283 / UCD 57-17) TaxID=436907 RepID=A7TNS0_VANPO|nr:uncharacterized protein Kpol_1016p2 [Vanderwaltozyma polyspora DSM 70294]EDO16063.1 hypothetical protein Kpol_1016p2 [Vanderwaltozyma polyspora DSM 70294]
MSSLQRRRLNRINSDTAESSNDDEERSKSTKIAYDPEEAKLKDDVTVPTLTLMEEVVLLGLGDKDGYLSFWNDNISYTLRGCIIIELALRNKIRILDDPARKRFDLSERLVEVVDGSKTGEVLLDEALQLMKNDEPLSIANWIDLLSGETWNFFKINYQLKQVRERISKGLVDKGVLRTEMKNFFLFDMATHPVTDTSCKEAIKRRILSALVSRTMELNYNEYFPETTQYKVIRTIALICSSYAANVLENVLSSLEYEKRDNAIARSESILSEFAQYPFKLDKASDIKVSINLSKLVEDEIAQNPGSALQLEAVAGVFDVFSKMDMIL